MQILNLEFLYVTAIVFTITAFLSKNDNNPESFISKIFFFGFGGISWIAFALGSFKQYWLWGGDNNLVDYTFQPVNGEDLLAWIYAAMGIIMILVMMAKCLMFVKDRLMVNVKQVIR